MQNDPMDAARTAYEGVTGEVVSELALRKALDAYLSATVPAEGVTPKLVGDAMQEAWDEICSDTAHHPLDIQHGKGSGLYFSPRHWADLTAMYLNAALAASRLSQGAGVRDDQVQRLTEENEALRKVVSECAASLMNGAAISTDATIGFMKLLSTEIQMVILAYKARIKALEEALSKVLRSEYESEEPGLCDCIDNDGNAYQSQYLATAIAEGEALLARSAPQGDTV